MAGDRLPWLCIHSSLSLRASRRACLRSSIEVDCWRVRRSAATRATNRVLWNRYVLPRLGGHRMVVLAHQPEIVQEFKAELVADGVGDPTIKRTLTVLSAVLGKAVEWNRIPSNPVATVRKPSGSRSKPVCTLAPEAVERLRVAMPSERDRRLVSVLAYSGLKPGEALALESMDVGKKTISVTRAIKLDGPGDNVNGKTKRSYTGATPYDLRHSFASLMFHEQRNPLEIADMLGHSPQVLFSTYAHFGVHPPSAEQQIQAARSRIHNGDT